MSMFTLNGAPILADEISILTELKNQLAANGIYRFKTFRTTTNHIQFNCPFHKGGQESKPSCGIVTRDIHYGNGKVVKAGTVHCFACGYVGTLETMISELFGRNDFGIFGKEWLRKNFTTVEYEERPEIKLDMSRGNKKAPQTFQYVSEDELDTYRYTHPYMYQRKLTDEVIEMFDVGYDKDFVLKGNDGKESHLRCITFPVRDITGGTLFIARRSVDMKFFHYPAGTLKPIYGIYELSKLPEYPHEIIVCESIFNCLTCYVYGRPAIALNGTGSDSQLKELKSLPCRKLILGLDPDNAGRKGRKRIRDALSGSKIITELDIPEGKDINDLTRDEFDGLAELL